MARRPRPTTTSSRSGTADSAGGRSAERLPLWRSVARSLEKDIVSGRLAAGSRLPTETALARQFGVNRHTLRRSIAELVKKGLLRSAPQTGSFVAPLRIPFALSPTSRLTDAIEGSGATASARMLSARICMPPPDVARHLAVATRTPVIELNILRLANDLPFAFVTVWLPADRFAGIDKLFELTGGLRRAMAKAGIRSFTHKSTRIMARAGGATECERLELEPGSIVITLEVVDVDPADEPFAVFLCRFPALRTEFVIGS